MWQSPYWLELVIALAYYAGMRRGEIGHARWEEIDWLKSEILVHGTKSHKDRAIPLPSQRGSASLRRNQGAGLRPPPPPGAPAPPPPQPRGGGPPPPPAGLRRPRAGAR